jgi:undecaprenyl-diphosphatase
MYVYVHDITRRDAYPRAVDSRSRPFFVAGVLAVAFVALAIAVRLGPLPGDAAMAAALAGQFHQLAEALTRLTSSIVWSTLVVAGVVGLLLSRHPRAALVLFLADATSEGVLLLIKAAVDRPRPEGAVLSDVIATASFPSSHAARATLVLALVLFAAGRAAGRRVAQPVLALSVAVGVVFLLLVGVARVAIGEHWPSDVFGGYLFGAAWAMLWLGLYARGPDFSRRG